MGGGRGRRSSADTNSFQKIRPNSFTKDTHIHPPPPNPPSQLQEYRLGLSFDSRVELPAPGASPAGCLPWLKRKPNKPVAASAWDPSRGPSLGGRPRRGPPGPRAPSSPNAPLGGTSCSPPGLAAASFGVGGKRGGRGKDSVGWETGSELRGTSWGPRIRCRGGRGRSPPAPPSPRAPGQGSALGLCRGAGVSGAACLGTDGRWQQTA